MAQRPPLPFPTCSQLDLMSRCPASFWGARDTDPRPLHAGNYQSPADVGSNVHACIEQGFKSGHGKYYDLIASCRKSMQLDCIHEYDQAQQAVLRTLSIIRTYPHFQSDVIYFPQRTIVKRESKRSVINGYGQAESGTSLGGTADLIVTCRYGCCFIVVDWKTGFNKQVPVVKNLQMYGLSFLARGIYGNRCVGMIVSYTSIGIVQSYSPTESDIATNDIAITILSDGFMFQLQGAGAHCAYCKRKTVCQSFGKMQQETRKSLQ